MAQSSVADAKLQYKLDINEGRYARHYITLQVGDPVFPQIFMEGGDAMSGSLADVWTGTPYYYMARRVASPLTVSASYYYAVRHWLHVGGRLGVYGETYTYRDARREGQQPSFTRRDVMAYLMASARFQFLDRKYVGLYASLSIGIMGEYNHNAPGHVEGIFIPYPTFEATFLGLRVGDQVYWTLELGPGLDGIVTTGIGTRF